jgi:hypothetical protein
LLPITDRQPKGSVERFRELLDVVRLAGKSDPLKGDADDLVAELVHVVKRAS